MLLRLISEVAEVRGDTCTCSCVVIPSPVINLCRVGVPVGKRSIHRGLYVSLEATRLGNYVLPAGLQNILGDRVKEDNLLTFITKNGVDSLSFYDLSSILLDNVKKERLSDFVISAKNCGVVETNAIGSVKEDWDRILAYNKGQPGTFTGLVTEIEFWNEGSGVHNAFLDYIAQLKYIKSLSSGLKVITYLGWLDRDSKETAQNAANEISSLVDRVMLHCYVKDPKNAYGYCTTRLALFPNSEVWPIYSVESSTRNAGGEVFMGDWMAKMGSMTVAESYFNGVKGYQWYEFGFF